jgi:Gylcosyl hydrolase family 115 C-terminal domain
LITYFKNPGQLKLAVQSGALAYGWFNPRTGDGLDALIDSGQTQGRKEVTFETPGQGDWLLYLKRMGNASVVLKDLTEIEATAAGASGGPYTLIALRDFEGVSDSTFIPFYKDEGRGALAINAGRHKDKFAAAQAAFEGDSGTYDITIATVTETDGESTYRLSVAGKAVGTFTNPRTSQDYNPARHTWKKVSVKKGDTVSVAFNTASNQKKKEGNGFGYSRGRWTTLEFTPAGPGDMIFEEGNGIVAAEAEHFSRQRLAGKRRWYAATANKTPSIEPDGDDNHAADASGGAYMEVLPDTRRTHADKLTGGVNFSNKPGQMAVLSYWVHFRTPGRYYVWVRAYSTGSEDNGLHVGLDGQWPESGQRLQWCEGKNTWRWESKQRTEKTHCGEPYKIYLDVTNPGLRQISFSMREDGFEFDKWLMTTDRGMGRPEDGGPTERIYKTGPALPSHIVSRFKESKP